MDYQHITKTVTLPACGLEAVVREPDGIAEDIIHQGLEKIQEALPKFWAYCTVRIGDKEKVRDKDVLDLFMPDINFLGIEIFRLTTPQDDDMLRDRLLLTGICPHCGKPEKYQVNLGGLDLMPLPDGADPRDPEFDFTLPRSRHLVRFGYLRGRDDLASGDRGGFDLKGIEMAAIRSINGSPKFGRRDINQWPYADHRALRDEMEAKQCGYDTRVRFVHECGKSVVSNLLTDPSFVLLGLAG
ncbi:MAG: hypothetical protein WBG50_26240 [Desulfomonilaceae bacterium]